MVGERSNLDYGRDDTPDDETQSIEGDGFVMTEPDDPGGGVVVDEEADEEVNPEASTYGAP